MLCDHLFPTLAGHRNGGSGDAEAAGDIDPSVAAGKRDMANDASGVRNTLHPGLGCQFRLG
jgi:hypothetical protein